jgi:O-antigen/teichoic acid export membrane protein
LWGNNWIHVADFLPYFGVLITLQTLLSTAGNIYLLMEKERTFMYIGVFTAFLMVAAIIVGSFYSVLSIAIFYTICFIVLIVPIHLYVGFYKTFNYSVKYIMKFWMPKLILGFLLVVALLLEQRLMLFILLSIYLIHILFYQRKDIQKLKELVIKKKVY